MDAIEVLEREHHHIASLFETFDYASEREKESMLDEVLDAIALHVKAEAAHLVPALQRRDETVVQMALSDHRRIRETAAALDMIGVAQAIAELSELRSIVTAHIRWERDVLMPRTVELIEPRQRELVGEAMSELEAELCDEQGPRWSFVPTSERTSARTWG